MTWVTDSNVTPGGFASNNVEYVGFLPSEEGTAHSERPQLTRRSGDPHRHGGQHPQRLHVPHELEVHLHLRHLRPLKLRLTATKPIGFKFEKGYLA